MNQRDGFSSGFAIGSLLGGIIGGVLGAVVATRVKQKADAVPETLPMVNPPTDSLESRSPEKILAARRSLEEKISQLNSAIDDVRQQLSAAQNGNFHES